MTQFVLGFYAFKQKRLVALKLTSHGILCYLRPADAPKGFFQLIMSVFIFSQFFCQWILPSGKL